MSIRETTQYQDFLSALRMTPRDWFISETNRIRRGNRDGWISGDSPTAFCPLTAVFDSAEANKLTHDFYWPIANAADNEHIGSYDYPEIRQDLLEACGLA